MYNVCRWCCGTNFDFLLRGAVVVDTAHLSVVAPALRLLLADKAHYSLRHWTASAEDQLTSQYHQMHPEHFRRARHRRAVGVGHIYHIAHRVLGQATDVSMIKSAMQLFARGSVRIIVTSQKSVRKSNSLRWDTVKEN